ncbi:MAG TPA: phage tail tape measure protein, partial [Chryseobacterium sp.]|nr:phage tail tape measure protein [Chryseobacterium sp.]
MASAKKIRDEIMSMTIVVNSNPAQQEIHKLTQKNKELTDESKKLNKEREKIAQTLGEESQEYKDLTKKIEDNNTAVTINKNKVKDLTDSLDINQMTVKQLRQELSLLNRALNERVAPGTEQYAALQKRIAEVRDRIKEVRNGADDSANGFDKVSELFNEYAGVATAVVGTLAGVALSVQEVIDRNNELTDAMSAVEKSTGLTTSEVKELSSAFNDLDTRTKSLDLLKIAEIGGKLGVPKAEILDFTREVDKAYVALGDSFSGGVEAVAEKIGKIKGLFKETKDLDFATALNKIGSGLNELGAEGAASEENMSDFALRVGQLPDSLKPTVAETLALGGAFEESGIDAERASSGYSTFVRTAAKDAAGFAKVMHLTQSEVEKLINEDPLQFFLKFSEGAKGLDPVKLAQILDGLKLNSNEVISIIGAASENTDNFRKSIESSNIAINEATSLQQEFDKVNNNAAAIYEKVQKKFAAIFTSDTVAKALGWLVDMIGRLIGVTNKSGDEVSGFTSLLIFLTRTILFVIAGIVSYSFSMALYNNLVKESILKNLALEAVEKGREIRLKLINSLQSLYNYGLGIGATLTARVASAIGAQTVATNMQTIATERLNAASAANPYLAIISIIMLLVIAYKTWKSHVDDVREAEKKQYEESHRYQTQQNEIIQKGKQAVEEYKNGIANLIAVIKDENSSQEMRKKSYESLIKLHPEFIGTVDAEFKATKKLTEVYQELAKQIDISARVKARTAAKQSIYDEIAKAEMDYMKGAAAREKEQQERNKLRKEYSYNPDRANSAVLMFGSFEEHNKGVDLLNKINSNNKLLQQYKTTE